MLVVGPVVIWTAACASSTATIPSATPSPSAALTTIAPGVSVNSSKLALPPYSVSASNPLPNGTSAKKIVADFIDDDVIENAAIVRKDPELLAYADTGNVLLAEQQEIASDSSGRISVLNIRDVVANIELGSKSDPNDPSANIAVIAQGRESREERVGTAPASRNTHDFDVLTWVVWSPARARYLLCDTASA
jgi:hypothetical protein